MYISISARQHKTLRWKFFSLRIFSCVRAGGGKCWWCLAINKIIWLHTRTASNGFSFQCVLLMYPSNVCSTKDRFRHNIFRIGRCFVAETAESNRNAVAAKWCAKCDETFCAKNAPRHFRQTHASAGPDSADIYWLEMKCCYHHGVAERVGRLLPMMCHH